MALRRSTLTIGTVALALGSVATLTADASTPDRVVFGAGPESTPFTAGPFVVPNPAGCTGLDDPTCDVVTVELGTAGTLEIALDGESAGSADVDLYLYDAAGTEIERSADTGSDESVIVGLDAGTYHAQVQPFLVPIGATDTTVDGTILFAPEPGPDGDGPGPSLFELEPAACITGQPPGVSPVAPASVYRVSPEASDLVHDAAGIDRLELRVALVVDTVDGKSTLSDEVLDHTFAVAAQAYDALRIDMVTTRYTTTVLPNDGIYGGNSTVASAAIEQVRTELGGGRPAGYDVVVIATDKDLHEATIGNGVLGLADCIGGVRSDRNAFAVVELDSIDEYQIGPLAFYHEAGAKTVAHEIGHLMGGHHHYAVCAEGVVNEMPAEGHDDGTGPSEEHYEGSICSLMSNFVDFDSLDFGSVNSQIVRSFADHRERERP